MSASHPADGSRISPGGAVSGATKKYPPDSMILNGQLHVSNEAEEHSGDHSLSALLGQWLINPHDATVEQLTDVISRVATLQASGRVDQPWSNTKEDLPFPEYVTGSNRVSIVPDPSIVSGRFVTMGNPTDGLQQMAATNIDINPSDVSTLSLKTPKSEAERSMAANPTVPEVFTDNINWAVTDTEIINTFPRSTSNKSGKLNRMVNSIRGNPINAQRFYAATVGEHTYYVLFDRSLSSDDLRRHGEVMVLTRICDDILTNAQKPLTFRTIADSLRVLTGAKLDPQVLGYVLQRLKAKAVTRDMVLDDRVSCNNTGKAVRLLRYRPMSPDEIAKLRQAQ